MDRLFAVAGAAFCTGLVEFEQVRALGLPYPWVGAVVLALCLSLALGAVQGVLQAWRARSRPEIAG